MAKIHPNAGLFRDPRVIKDIVRMHIEGKSSDHISKNLGISTPYFNYKLMKLRHQGVLIPKKSRAAFFLAPEIVKEINEYIKQLKEKAVEDFLKA